VESFPPEVRILGNSEELAREAAKVFLNRIDEALRARGISGWGVPQGKGYYFGCGHAAL